MTEVEQPSQNGIDPTTEDDSNKARPADIEADMREMERRKRVEAIMSSKLFREELERIVDSQIREGGASGILQQLSDIVGVPAARVGSVFKSSNCVTPINDIRGVESMGYSKGEKILRCKLAATFRLLDLYGWTQGLGAQVTARLNADQELFLVNPFGLLFHEVTASSLNKVDMQGNVVEQGTTNFGINTNQYILHSVVHAARPDIRCAIYVGCNPVVAVSSLKVGVVPLTKDSAVLGEIAIHPYTGSLNEPEEREKLIRSLGPISKVLLLNNHGALCCGETIEEAFYAAYHIVQACETQLKLLPVGLDNLVLIPEESRKAIYDASRRPPDGYEHKTSSSSDNQQQQPDNKERLIHQKPKWRVGGAEFEALMRMLDNAGFRTGYIYRHPLVKSELPKPKNDVEVPPAVSSLGYLLEEEELYRQGIWKKSDLRKGGDRTRWLNSPNVYQKVEVLETGTPDPKKITKWVADGSPTHSTAMRIDTLQFVPPGTNPKEFKKLQQQIKDNRRADKISAGPQSHILEGVTWDEANRIKDATVSSTGDHVVLMGAASKGIIQRGYQHNATVYKAPYAKNPFDSVTDDELNEYKRTVERKHGHGEYTDTDFSESEALSSLQTSGAQQKSPVKNAPSQSETEDVSEPQVLRIETKQAPKPSQPEVVLSDATNDFLNVERVHSATSKKPPTGRAFNNNNNNNHSLKTIIQTSSPNDSIPNSSNQAVADSNSDYSQNTKIDKYLTQAGAYNYSCSDSSSKNALKELSLYKSVDSDCYDFVRLDYIDMNGRRASHDDGIFSATDSIKVFDKFRNPYFDKLYEPSKLYNQDDEISVYDYVETDFSPSAKLNLYDYHVYETLSDCCLLASPSSNNLIYDSVNNFSNVSTFRIEVNNSSQVKYNLLPPPYRTSSHFGFNYPTYIEPDHKHIPLYPSKYIPLKRNESFDECFSSGRFVNMPLSTFNKILKRKAHDSMIRSKGMDFGSPILTEKRIRLSTPTDGSSIETDSDIDTESRPEDFDSNFEENDYENFRSDYQILKNIRNKFLDPIEEEEESESVNKLKMKPVEEGEIVDKACSTHMKSMFIEKITQMNYSNESPNTGFIPLNKAITSDITLNIDDPSLKDEVVTVNIEDLDQKMNSLTLEEKKNETIELKDENKEIIFPRVDTPRKLMRRPERDHRKQEFYDLWEDHISFYGQSKDDDDSESDEMLFFSMGNSFDKKSIDDQNDTAANGVRIVDENDPCLPERDIALGMARISPTLPENEITNNHSSGDRVLFFHYDHVNDHYLPHQYVDSIENCIPPCDDQNNNNTCTNANGNNDIEYVMDNVNRSCNPDFVDDNFRKTVNEQQKSLPMTEEYFKLNSIDNSCTPTSHHTNSNNGEDELNSIEKLILTKIANSDLDRNEGSIFRKIETTIRTKVTPSKLEQKIRDEISKTQSSQVHSSTPTTDNVSSETNSFGSMNLSNIKSNVAKSYWTSLSSDGSVKTPPNTNYTSTSSSNEKRNAEHPGPSTRLKQPATKNVSRVHTPRPFSRLQSRINSSSSSQQTSKEEKGNIRVDLRVKSPSKGKKTGKRKRNFITENIMNVSVQRKKQNLGAIFSINPFGGSSTESDTTTNIRLNIQQNLPSEAVYSFQTESVNGSPRLWVSISPPKLKLPISSAIASKKKITTTGKQKKKPLKLSDDNKKITQNVKSNGQKVTGIGGGDVQGEIEKLGKATENLSKYVTKCENGINLYGKQIRKLSANIDEIAELQENIENDRMELRNEMRRSNRNLDMISYSLSAEDD